MSEFKKTYRIFISAAEPSADAHCANLIISLKAMDKSIEFVGIGGPKMEAAGCKLLENTVERASMLYNALANISYFRNLLKRIKEYFANNKTDLVIVCDSPAFNFHVAKAAKQTNIKTMFYVAPQLWAWGAWRIGKLRKSCDKLCCILPFEEQWFSSRGIDTTFVGNPLLDERDKIDKIGTDKIGTVPILRETKNAGRRTNKIALMPGSRDAEIETLWQSMQQIAIELKKKHPELSFTAVALNDKKLEKLKALQVPGFNCEYVLDSVEKTASSVDFTIVASGSATLEVASAGCPMAIMYQSNKILWHLIGKFLIKTKYLSLVNILAQRELVPEFMPYFSSIEPIIQSIDSLLNDSDKLEQTSKSLYKLVEPLAQKITREEVAKIAMEMLSKES